MKMQSASVTTAIGALHRINKAAHWAVIVCDEQSDKNESKGYGKDYLEETRRESRTCAAERGHRREERGSGKQIIFGKSTETTE